MLTQPRPSLSLLSGLLRRWMQTATALITFGSASATYARTVTPARTSEAWTFDGWGTSLCWFANAVGRWPDVKRTEIADALFAPSGLGLTVVRYNIGGGEQPGHNHMPWFRQMEGFQNEDGQWNWEADAGQRWMLKAAKARGAQRFEAFSNSPPWWMTRSRCASGAIKASEDNLAEGQEEVFSLYLSTVVRQLQKQDGIVFDTIDPMNEPWTDYWRAGHNQEGCHFDHASQRRLIQTLRRVLDREGLSALAISASDETNYTRAIESWQAYDDATRACVAQVNAHAYDTKNRAELRALIAASGKPLVMSEVDGAGDKVHDHGSINAALALANGILDDLRDLRPLRWIFWQAVEDETGQKNSNGNWGLIHADLAGDSHSWSLTKKYHMMGQFSRFLRPGVVMLPINDPDTVCALDEANGRVVFVLRNLAETEEQAGIDLGQLSLRATAVEVYRTSAQEDLARLDAPLLHEDRFEIMLPPRSVTTVVVGVAR